MVFRRRFNRTVIQSFKHVIDAEGGLTDVKSNIPIYAGVINKTVPLVLTDVQVGAKVTSFFLSIFIIGITGAPVSGAQDWYVIKIRAGQGTGQLPDPGSTGLSPFRNQIIHEEKGLVGSGDGTAMAFKGVIKIPPGM